jgi:hypothetical protein
MSDELPECRICGFAGRDVLERMQRYPTEPALRLCDYCACSGEACSGRDPRLENLALSHLSAMLRTLERRLREALVSEKAT